MGLDVIMDADTIDLTHDEDEHRSHHTVGTGDLPVAEAILDGDRKVRQEDVEVSLAWTEESDDFIELVDELKKTWFVLVD